MAAYLTFLFAILTPLSSLLTAAVETRYAVAYVEVECRDDGC